MDFLRKAVKREGQPRGGETFSPSNQVKKGVYFVRDESLVAKLITEGKTIDGKHPVEWLEDKYLIQKGKETAEIAKNREAALMAILLAEINIADERKNEQTEEGEAYRDISKLHDERGKGRHRDLLEKALALATAKLAYAGKQGVGVPTKRLARLEQEYRAALAKAKQDPQAESATLIAVQEILPISEEQRLQARMKKMVRNGVYYDDGKNLIEELIREGVDIDGQHPVAWLEENKEVDDQSSQAAIKAAENKIGSEQVSADEKVQKAQEVKNALFALTVVGEKYETPPGKAVREAIDKAKELASVRLAYLGRTTIPSARIKRIEDGYKAALAKARKEAKGDKDLVATLDQAAEIFDPKIKKVRDGVYFDDNGNLVERLIKENIELEGKHPVAWLEENKGIYDNSSQGAIMLMEQRLARELLSDDSKETLEVREAYEKISKMVIDTRGDEYKQKPLSQVRNAIIAAQEVATARFAYLGKSFPEARLQRLEENYQAALKKAEKAVEKRPSLLKTLGDLAVTMISIHKWTQFVKSGFVLPSWAKREENRDLVKQKAEEIEKTMGAKLT